MAKTFLGLGYKLSGGAATTRIYVWRALKDAGAVAFQQGMFLLPRSDGSLSLFENLRQIVGEAGGTTNLVEVTFVHDEDETALIGEFRKLRDEEYAELAENCTRMIEELDRETGANNYAYPELEEAEHELQKLTRWAEKIGERDCFQAEGRQNAREQLDRARERLDAYATAVYSHEKTNET